jgi:hypothetical protein
LLYTWYHGRPVLAREIHARLVAYGLFGRARCDVRAILLHKNLRTIAA